MAIKFLKLRKVNSPLRNEAEDAGIDFFVPEKSDEVIQVMTKFNPNIRIEDNFIIIPPHEDILIPTGLKGIFDHDLMMMAANKSGVATKNKLVYGAEIVDYGYKGEWHIHLINWTNYDQKFEFGKKIIQFVPVKISTEKHEVIDIEDMTEEEFFKDHNTERGANGFGSKDNIKE